VPDPRRIARLKQFVLEVAATTIQRELRDPRIGFVTVTRVDLAPDLTQATVWWSALGTDAQRRTSERALEDARPVVQSAVAHALATRTTPRLAFRFDDTLVQAQRLEGIFETIKQQRPAPGEPAEDAAPRSDGDEVADDRATDERDEPGAADDRATDEEKGDDDEADESEDAPAKDAEGATDDDAEGDAR
jgi:ribosome-binding factor A